MKNARKLMALILVLALMAVLLTACSNAKQPIEDPSTLTINMQELVATQIMPALRAKFPEINFEVNAYVGGNASRYLRESLNNGEGGDLFFYTTFLNSDDTDKYLINLSGYPFLSNLDKGILSTLDLNGSIYQIPGPIVARYMVANKTLFDEHGWKVPENFSEMVEACRQIRKDTPDIVPIALGTAGMGYVFTPVTSYAQMGYLDTADGRRAEREFRQGTASFGKGFSEGLDMMAELIDAGAFDAEKYEQMWDISHTVMGNREAAMCYVMNGSLDMAKLINGEAKGDTAYGEYNTDEFVAFPYYGRNDKNRGLILGTANTWGINKRLEEKGNEKKLENALKVMEYLTTEEGQITIRSNNMSIPVSRDLKSEDVPEFLRELWNDNANSIKTFFLYTGYEHMMVETAQVILDAMKAGSSEGMKEKAISVADSLNEVFVKGENTEVPMGYVEDNISVEQTRRLSCEAFAAAAKTDIAIASEASHQNRYGLGGKLFKGDLVRDALTMIVYNNKSSVVSVSLTGAEIKEMLENGKIIKAEDGTETVFRHWSSGIEMTRTDDKITELKLNGKPMDEGALYEVAMLSRDYSEQFESEHEIKDTGINLLDALAEYFMTLGTIKAE